MKTFEEAHKAFECYRGSYPMQSSVPFAKEIFMKAFEGGHTVTKQSVKEMLEAYLPNIEYITSLSALRLDKKRFIEKLIEQV